MYLAVGSKMNAGCQIAFFRVVDEHVPEVTVMITHDVKDRSKITESGRIAPKFFVQGVKRFYLKEKFEIQSALDVGRFTDMTQIQCCGDSIYSGGSNTEQVRYSDGP